MIGPSCYIAAPWEQRRAASTLADKLTQFGIHVLSKWHDGNESPVNVDQFPHYAAMSLAWIQTARVFVALNFEEFASKGTGGRHVEFGYALALGKPILLVGDAPGRNVFHHLPEVKHLSELAGTEELAALIRDGWE